MSDFNRVDAIVYCVENLSKERARSWQESMLMQHGCLFSRIEDRSADGEGWAIVTYFHPSAMHYGHIRKDAVKVSRFPAGAMEIYRAYDAKSAA